MVDAHLDASGGAQQSGALKLQRVKHRLKKQTNQMPHFQKFYVDFLDRDFKLGQQVSVFSVSQRADRQTCLKTCAL